MLEQPGSRLPSGIGEHFPPQAPVTVDQIEDVEDIELEIDHPRRCHHLLAQRRDRRARPRLAATVTCHDLAALTPQTGRARDEVLERASLRALASEPRCGRRVGARQVSAELDLRRVERAPRNVDRIVRVGAVGVQITASTHAVRRIGERSA